MSSKPEVRSSIPIKLIYSCIDSLFAGLTSTVHKNQIHCSGVVQWWVCSSLMSAALPVCRGKLRNFRADCWRFWWTLFRNSNTATEKPWTVPFLVSIYCDLLAPQWKAKSQIYLCAQVGNTWSLKCSITRLGSQNRKFASMLIITEEKKFISICANKLGLSIRGSEIL